MADEQVQESVQEEATQAPQEEDNTPSKEEALDNSKNPERTAKYIDKQNEQIQDLKKANEKYKNVLDSLVPEEPVPQQAAQYQAPINQAPQANQFQNLDQKTIDDEFKSMVDKDGFLDGAKLLSTLKSLDQRARKAEEEAKKSLIHAQKVQQAQQQSQKSALMQDVHSKYPQIDPDSDQFDEKYYDLVRNELVGQMINGKKEDPMAAAAKFADLFVKEEPVTKEEREQKETKDEQKKQINATRPRSTSSHGFYESNEDEDLISKVRKGKKGALAEMLRRHEERNK